MRCPNCGAEIVSGDVFCCACGASLYNRYCSECGSILAPNQAHCSNCGTPVTVSQQQDLRFEDSDTSSQASTSAVLPTPISLRTRKGYAINTPHIGFRIGLGVLALLVVFVCGMAASSFIQGNKPASIASVQSGSVKSLSSANSESDSESLSSNQTSGAVQLPETSSVSPTTNVSDYVGASNTTPMADASNSTDSVRLGNGQSNNTPSDYYGIGGTYEVDSDGLVINRPYMFKFRIPNGCKGKMLTDNTILFRENGFTVTIEAWTNDGETLESRYKTVSNSIVDMGYETQSEGLFVVSGRDSRGHDMYTKEIIEPDRICRMVVDSEIYPCSARCEQVTTDFEGEFRLLR